MTLQNLSDYLFNKKKRELTTFVVNNEGRFYECKGVRIPENEFHQLFPLGDKIRSLHSGQMKGNGIGSAGI